MEQYIIDTNIFFNMEAGLGLGKTTEEVVKNITQLAQKLKKNSRAEFITSPHVIEEFLSFFDNKNQPFIQEFLSVVSVRSPDLGSIQASATIVSKLIEDVRIRSYRGLTIAEEEMKKAVLDMQGKKTEGKKEFEIAVGKHIKTFRDRYRNATRTGFLDSLADLDCILLAKSLDGYLISTDEGVVKWGRAFGVKEMLPAVWLKQMQSLL